MARSNARRKPDAMVPADVAGESAAGIAGIGTEDAVALPRGVVNGSPLAPSHLTEPEAELVNNIECLGLPVKKAAELAGVSVSLSWAPHIMQAREQVRKQIRGDVNITKEDVVVGVREAIDRAKIIAEPATEIRGWEVISKLLGYDSPQKIDINVRETISVVQQQVRSLPDAQLIEMLGAESIIDGQFYVLPPPA
jgi:hypothetical protein